MANKFGPVLVVLVSGWCGSLSQACSAGSDSCVESRTCTPEQSEATSGAAGSASAGRAGSGTAAGVGGGGVAGRADSGGTAGRAGAGPAAPACASDAACDDHLRCNGTETCVTGVCQAGFPIQCENAASCVEGTSSKACIYPDSSAWLVYEADEDTPAVDELYAVKESLMGVQRPIKVSAPLLNAPSERLAALSLVWSADGQWLMFGTTENQNTVSSRYYAVRFAGGIPEAPVELSAGLPLVSFLSWSPTGHELLFKAKDGSLFWLHLTDDALVDPVRLNLSNQEVSDAIWASNATVVYTTKEGAAYRVSVGTNPAATPARFTSQDGIATPDACWASLNGAWAVCESDLRSPVLANVAAGQIQRIGKDALDPTRISWRFSPDSHYLAYTAAEHAVGQSEVYLLDLTKSGLPRTMVDVTTLDAAYALGTWSPDSSFFTYLGEGREAGQARLNVYDVLRGEQSPTSFEVSTHDWEAGSSLDGARVLYSTRNVSGDPSELVGIDREGRAQYFDEDNAGRPYLSAEFARDGSAALYCTRVDDQTTDMVYADLRGPLATRSVRVPGDGSVYSCAKGFGATSKGFAYYRFAPDGARTLYWVDLSKQVMAKPTKISGDGRVRTYDWQPVANATN